MSGCFSPASLEDRDDLAVRCDCFRHQLPDRVPLRQLVGFVISSSLQQRAPTSTPCQQCLEQSEFNGLAALASASNFVSVAHPTQIGVSFERAGLNISLKTCFSNWHPLWHNSFAQT